MPSAGPSSLTGLPNRSIRAGETKRLGFASCEFLEPDRSSKAVEPPGLTPPPDPLPRPKPVIREPAPKPPPRPEPAPPQQPQAGPKPPFTPQRAGDTDRLVSYYGLLRSLPPEQLAREHERTMRFYREQYSDFTFMQVVLLQMIPGTPFRDSTQARDMLSSWLKEPRTRTSELRPLALLLHTMLVEQQQKDADNQAQAQKLREETRRYDEVKQKLDALIDAERKMLDRNKPMRKP